MKENTIEFCKNKLKELELRNNVNYYDTFPDWERQLNYDRWQKDLLRNILNIKN